MCIPSTQPLYTIVVNYTVFYFSNMFWRYWSSLGYITFLLTELLLKDITPQILKKLLLLYWILSNICAGLIYKVLHKIMKLNWLWWVVVQLKYCVYSSTLKIKAICYFKTSVYFYCTTLRYISEDSTLQSPLWRSQIWQIITRILTEYVKAQYNAVPHVSSNNICSPYPKCVTLIAWFYITCYKHMEIQE